MYIIATKFLAELQSEVLYGMPYISETAIEYQTCNRKCYGMPYISEDAKGLVFYKPLGKVQITMVTKMYGSIDNHCPADKEME